MDWLTANPWAAWLALALILGAVEMLTLDLTLLMLAVGAAAAGMVALFLPGSFIIQVLVALAVAVLLLGFLRPTLLKKVRSAPGYKSRLEELVGHVGVAEHMITATQGEVEVNGETWTARASKPGQIIEPGAQYVVERIDGTTVYLAAYREITP